MNITTFNSSGSKFIVQDKQLDSRHYYFNINSPQQEAAFTTSFVMDKNYGEQYELDFEIKGSPVSYQISGQFANVDVDDLSPREYYNILSALPGNIFEDTMAFQVKYGLFEKRAPGFIEHEKIKVKLDHLREELDECIDAFKYKDFNEFCDGLLDLIYIASGTLNLCNAPAKQLWNDIQIRNMSKIRATSDTIGKRGTTFDVVKPEDWSGPRTGEIISETR